MVIDPKGTLCMWKGPFIDYNLIIRGLGRFSTSKPTFKPINQQKDGVYNYLIDVEDGHFYVTEKNSISKLLSSVDSEISVGPKTAILKSDGEASSSSSTPTTDGLQLSGSDLDVFGQSLNLCSPLTLTSGDERLRQLSSFHYAIFQIPGDLLGKPILPDIEFLTPCNRTSLRNGTCSDRPALTRQISKVNASDSDLKEVKILQACIGQPNVLLSLIVEDDHFYNVVIKPYICSLDDIISSPDHPLAGKTKDFLRDATNGLLSLHQLGIFHGDLNPSNVKICKGLSPGSYTAKITDMTGCGSIADDFADLGHLCFFTLTEGQFPLKDTLKDDVAIKTAGCDLRDDHLELHDLIYDVLLRKPSIPSTSPTTAEVFGHPCVFDQDKCASFLKMSSDVIEYEKGALLRAIEKLGNDVYGNNWGDTLNIEPLCTLKYYNGYSETSMCRLLRAIRNGCGHSEQRDQSIVAVIGKTYGEIANYYCTTLPKLLIKVYRVMEKHSKKLVFRDVYFKWCV
ncbi:serine/threonine-protein kinase/endoribonuclease IRE1-like [Rutidosis leptorrhynchoides]|uniref:serine/threonine-protein kinase/endoribonuclease IRE1-like n=1 Tax=Rutidosis leptorrhynchoides TaxID=125765 RepID=UPI003A98F36B